MLSKFSIAASASWFIAVLFDYKYPLLVVGYPVRAGRGRSTLYAYCMYFGDMFCNRHQRGYRAERAAFIIHIQPCDDYTNAAVGKLYTHMGQLVVKKLGFVYPYDLRLRAEK